MKHIIIIILCTILWATSSCIGEKGRQWIFQPEEGPSISKPVELQRTRGLRRLLGLRMEQPRVRPYLRL